MPVKSAVSTDYIMHPDGRVLIRYTRHSGGQSWIQGDKVVAPDLETFRADKRYHGVAVHGAPTVDSVRDMLSGMDLDQVRQFLADAGHPDALQPEVPTGDDSNISEPPSGEGYVFELAATEEVDDD